MQHNKYCVAQSKECIKMTNAYDIQAIQLQIQKENEEKIKNLRNRIEKFAELTTLEEAKELAKTVFRAEKEFQEFSVAGVKCVIVNKEDSFRISYNSTTDYICYDFA